MQHLRLLLVSIAERRNRGGNVVRCQRSPERRLQPHRGHAGRRSGPNVRAKKVRAVVFQLDLMLLARCSSCRIGQIWRCGRYCREGARFTWLSSRSLARSRNNQKLSSMELTTKYVALSIVSSRFPKVSLSAHGGGISLTAISMARSGLALISIPGR
jgi:hypothetical protein